jgi:hypothetical protein
MPSEQLETIRASNPSTLEDVIRVTNDLAAIDPILASSPIRPRMGADDLERVRALKNIPASYLEALGKAGFDEARLGAICLNPALDGRSIVETLVRNWDAPLRSPATGLETSDGSVWRTVGWIESDPIVIGTSPAVDGVVGFVPWEHAEREVRRLAPNFDTFLIAAARLYLRELADDPDAEPPLQLTDLGLTQNEVNAWNELRA